MKISTSFLPTRPSAFERTALATNDTTTASALPTNNAAITRPTPKLAEITRLKNLTAKAETKTDLAAFYVTSLRNLAIQSSNASLGEEDRALLQTEFDATRTKLETLIDRAQFQGQKLLDGTLNIAPSARLSSALFTGASNQPTQEQATLTITNPLPLEGIGQLSITTEMGGQEASAALNDAYARVTTSQQDIKDFKAALQFAENTVLGRPNTGPSITQTNFVTTAEAVARGASEGLSALETSLLQLRDIAINAQNDALSDADRAFLSQDFMILQHQTFRIVDTTSVNNVAILKDPYTFDLQPVLSNYLTDNASGTTPPTAEQSALQLPGFSDLLTGISFDMSSPENRLAALDSLNNALEKTQAAQSEVNAFTNALQFAKNAMGTPAAPVNITA